MTHRFFPSHSFGSSTSSWSMAANCCSCALILSKSSKIRTIGNCIVHIDILRYFYHTVTSNQCAIFFFGFFFLLPINAPQSASVNPVYYLKLIIKLSQQIYVNLWWVICSTTRLIHNLDHQIHWHFYSVHTFILLSLSFKKYGYWKYQPEYSWSLWRLIVY